MKNQDPSDDIFTALEASLHLLEHKSKQKAEAGACLFSASSGRRICVRLSQEDCEKIPGLRYIGGSCADALSSIK